MSEQPLTLARLQQEVAAWVRERAAVTTMLALDDAVRTAIADLTKSIPPAFVELTLAQTADGRWPSAYQLEQAIRRLATEGQLKSLCYLRVELKGWPASGGVRHIVSNGYRQE